jgi:hypothetical protein
MADEETAATATETDTQKDDARLGAEGQKALDAFKERARIAERAQKDHQLELERLRAELKKRDDADLSEMEKLRKQLAEAETQRQTVERDRQADRTRHLIEREAGRMRFADPADAFSLIDQTRIDFDAKGNPTNVTALLTELVKAKPYLSARPGTGSGEGGARGAGGAGGGFSMDDYIRRAAGR